MPTIQELAVKLNREAAQTLIRNVRAMPEDKVTWQPLDKGRTTLSQLQECAIICGFSNYTVAPEAWLRSHPCLRPHKAMPMKLRKEVRA